MDHPSGDLIRIFEPADVIAPWRDGEIIPAVCLDAAFAAILIYARSDARPIRKLGRCTRACDLKSKSTSLHRNRPVNHESSEYIYIVSPRSPLSPLPFSPPCLSLFLLIFRRFNSSDFDRKRSMEMTSWLRYSARTFTNANHRAPRIYRSPARSPDANISLVVGFGRFQCHLERDPRAALVRGLLCMRPSGRSR